MVDAPPNIEAADPRVQLASELRAAAPKTVDLFSTPFGIEAARMLLEGVPHNEVVRRMSCFGVATSTGALQRIKKLLPSLPEPLKAKVASSEPLSGEEKTAIQVLKSTMDSVATRIQAIEKEIKDGKDQKLVVTEKRDDQLLKYYAMYAELRKQLEQERSKSEVVQAYKRAAVDMCMLALDHIKDDDSKAKFLEKVREFQQRNL